MIHKNVYGRPLKYCNKDKITGYNRNGSCETFEDDEGTHIVCAVMTKDFLYFTYSRGNNLITPRRNFPGLAEGDNWCICALRWIEAYKAGYAPPIIGEATHEKFLSYVSKDVIMKHLV